MDELSDIVTAAQSGDQEAFGVLVSRFQRMAFAAAYASVGDTHLAEDVAQEAFLQAYCDLPTLRQPAAFPGWFRRIVFKHSDRLTRGKQMPLSPLDDALGVTCTDLDPPMIAERHAVQRRVWAEIARLPDHQRVVVMLFYLAGYSQQEIASFLDVPVSTVKKRLHDARARLMGRMLDMTHDSERVPSLPDDGFARKVQFLIAVSCGDEGEGASLLQKDRTLVTTVLTTEEWRRVEVVQHHALPMRFGSTPLHLAATYGHTALIDTLLAHGADIDADGPRGTPLHRAVLARDRVMVNLLLARGADVNAVTVHGMTPLERAVILGQDDIVKMLLAHNADSNCQDSAGRTPLHWAALHGAGDLTTCLLAHGARPDVRDATGRTPAAWAEQRGHTTVAAMLGQHKTKERAR